MNGEVIVEREHGLLQSVLQYIHTLQSQATLFTAGSTANAS